MEASLSVIQQFSQQMSEVISSVLGLEVVIIDDRLKLIAATGILAREIGSYYTEGTITYEILSSGGFHVVEDPKRDQTCRSCKRKDECKYLSALVASIKVGKVIGSLGIAATTYEQKERLLKNAISLQVFAEKFSDMLSIAIQGKEANLPLYTAKLPKIQKFDSRLDGYQANMTFDQIIGESHAIKTIKEKFKKIAATDSTILIQGESGTGKDLFARAVHEHSNRKKGHFIAINCAAIPEALLESELFGYDEGAFTGARRGGKPGKFELANHGTIFLDEIGDMPLNLQVKLLKVLEQNYIERVGGTLPLKIDLRIIAATQRNLEEMIARHEFREDLYYRLSVIPVTLLPLRERGEDIRLLLKHFTQNYARQLGKNILGFSPEALEIILRYQWPGNVRELENVIEYAVNMESGMLIQPENLPTRLLRAQVVVSPDSRSSSIKDMEKKAIVEALKKFGSKNTAASHLGISRSTLYRKLKEIEH